MLCFVPHNKIDLLFQFFGQKVLTSNPTALLSPSSPRYCKALPALSTAVTANTQIQFINQSAKNENYEKEKLRSHSKRRCTSAGRDLQQPLDHLPVHVAVIDGQDMELPRTQRRRTIPFLRRLGRFSPHVLAAGRSRHYHKSPDLTLRNRVQRLCNCVDLCWFEEGRGRERRKSVSFPLVWFGCCCGIYGGGRCVGEVKIRNLSI